MKYSRITKEIETCRKSVILKSLLFSVILILIISSAGCINEADSDVEITEVPIPSDISTAQLEIISDLKSFATSISVDLYELSEEIGSAKDEEEILDIGLEYYGNNIWIEKLIFCNMIDGTYVQIPKLSGGKSMADYLPVPSQKDLEDAGGILHVDCAYVPGEGYVSATYNAVYDKTGLYIGFVLIIYDNYAVLNLHPSIVNKDYDYKNYACFIVDNNNKIIYSTNSEYMGLTLEKGKMINTGQCVISLEDGEFGAYKYKSDAFYNYLRPTQSEKITAWQEYVSYKNIYRVYLTKELNQPEMKFTNVYDVDVQTTVKNVEMAFVYASLHSEDESFSCINGGVFSDEIYAVNMEGRIIASADSNTVGQNYMNARGTYGTSYMEAAVYTAQQGGGYVYYYYPVEPSIVTTGSQFSIAYVLPVNSEWFVFGRFSADAGVNPTDLSIRSDLTSVSRAVVSECYITSIDDVITKINSNADKNGRQFVSGITNDVKDIGILDYNGYVYADADTPNTVGTVLTGYTDVYGGSTIRKMIMLAKAGGGFINDLRKNPTKEGYIDLWLYSVEPIDDHYFAETGMIVGTYKDYLSEYMR